MNGALTRERVIEALRQVKDPELGRSLVDLGMVRDVRVEDGSVCLTLAVTTMACPLKAQMAASARAAAAALPGVQEVQIETVQMTEQERLRIFRGMSEQESSRIQRVVAVSSGKAGAGQSTVTALLAVELARRGRRVTTPQDSVARVVRRSLRMAQRVGVPVLGVVENMTHFLCPDTGRPHELFGSGQGEGLARLAGAPLLARLPLDPALSGMAHAGRIEEYASEGTHAMTQGLVVELAVAAAARGSAAMTMS